MLCSTARCMPSIGTSVRRQARRVLIAAALSLAGAGRWAHAAGAQQPMLAEPAFPDVARRIAASVPLARREGELAPDRDALVGLYASPSAAPLWTVAGHPSAQAEQLIRTLEGAANYGLRAGDFATDLVRARAEILRRGPATTADVARFDVLLSLETLRLLGDLHSGRIAPGTVGFALPASPASIGLADLVRAASRASAVDQVIAAAQPPYAPYAQLLRALGRYRALASDTTLAPPRAIAAVVHPGDGYDDAPRLRHLLTALGDIAATADAGRSPDSSAATDDPELYDSSLVAAVREFQRRHGLEPDGVIGAATLAELRVPLADRIRQIELTLERWRWLPDRPPSRFVIVNVPAFRLYAFEDDPTALTPALTMSVIVGQAEGRHATPLFVGRMNEVVFRPYWDVPPSIARAELIPRIDREPEYFERERLQIVRGGDDDAVSYPLSEDNLERVAAGTLRLRQKPGPANSLGLVKFLFPNAYDVYLHGTPEQALFVHSRRDFSHGCIRVEDPVALAAWVLRDGGGWDSTSVRAAMNGGRTRRLTLASTVEVFILYATVEATADGEVRFYGDLYGHDARLARALGM